MTSTFTLSLCTISWTQLNGFLIVVFAIYGLHQHSRTPATKFLKDFNNITLLGASQHNSNATKIFCRIYTFNLRLELTQQRTCNQVPEGFYNQYSYGPVTTQQRHQLKCPAGFCNKYSYGPVTAQQQHQLRCPAGFHTTKEIKLNSEVNQHSGLNSLCET